LEPSHSSSAAANHDFIGDRGFESVWCQTFNNWHGCKNGLLPKDIDPEFPEKGISGKKREAAKAGLSGEHPIKGIAVRVVESGSG
jgi:hypothetical protein